MYNKNREIQKISFKRGIILLLASMIMLVFMGCGAKKEEQEEKKDNSKQEEVLEKQEKADESSNQETIKVTDAKGEVEIPANPKRIVDLSGNSDILSILGYKVIGTANSDAYDYTKFPSYLEETLQGATILGYSMQDTMDIEAVMNVEPDLIIISTVQEKMYEQLKSIAPTVMIQLEAFDWKEDIKTIATVFHKTEEAEKWIAEYERKANEIGTMIKQKMGEKTSYLSFLASGGQFFVFSGAGFGSVLYDDMGLTMPSGMPEQSDISLPVVTYEGLAAIQADTIFVIATEEDLAELQANSIWNSLPAVKNKKVIILPSSPYFNQGYSLIGRQLLLDEIAEFIDEMEK